MFGALNVLKSICAHTQNINNNDLVKHSTKNGNESQKKLNILEVENNKNIT